MLWGLCSWRNMGALIRLDTTLIDDRVAPEALPLTTKIPIHEIIEHIRNALQRAVQKRSTAIPISTDLRKAVHDSWSLFSPEIHQTLIKSMPCHVKALLRARGGPTRY
ncbi:hypothetical protein TNCV_982961 [Trichonephila clavipes]|nr:hypothetical protein TNCV_982961 [Trichonephila clavipes]